MTYRQDVEAGERYLRDIREAREEYWIRTSDPYIHYLSVVLKAKEVYAAAKLEADKIYLEQRQAAWQSYREQVPDARIGPDGPVSLSREIRRRERQA